MMTAPSPPTNMAAAYSSSRFLGVIGMPPPEPGIHPTHPPRQWGGNIDCNQLGPGTTLYLPIPVDGALLSLGDAHARQGHGEPSGTAIETPTEHAQIRIDLDQRQLSTPVARTPDAWLSFGFHTDLDHAATIALEAMLELMNHEHGLERRDALALAASSSTSTSPNSSTARKALTPSSPTAPSTPARRAIRS
jgi:acetamidase/formamidase